MLPTNVSEQANMGHLQSNGLIWWAHFCAKFTGKCEEISISNIVKLYSLTLTWRAHAPSAKNEINSWNLYQLIFRINVNLGFLLFKRAFRNCFMHFLAQTHSKFYVHHILWKLEFIRMFHSFLMTFKLVNSLEDRRAKLV